MSEGKGRYYVLICARASGEISSTGLGWTKERGRTGLNNLVPGRTSSRKAFILPLPKARSTTILAFLACHVARRSSYAHASSFHLTLTSPATLSASATSPERTAPRRRASAHAGPLQPSSSSLDFLHHHHQPSAPISTLRWVYRILSRPRRPPLELQCPRGWPTSPSCSSSHSFPATPSAPSSPLIPPPSSPTDSQNAPDSTSSPLPSLA